MYLKTENFELDPACSKAKIWFKNCIFGIVLFTGTVNEQAEVYEDDDWRCENEMFKVWQMFL